MQKELKNILSHLPVTLTELAPCHKTGCWVSQGRSLHLSGYELILNFRENCN